MNKTTESGKNSSNNDHSSSDQPHSPFVRNRWALALALADQLRQNTELQKNEQLRKLAFDIPPTDTRQPIVITSVESQADHINSFQNELLFAKTGNFGLDKLADNFVDLKRTFNRMLQLKNDDIQQVQLSTSITKTALLIVLRAIESIANVISKGNRLFPTFNSVISFIRACDLELPLPGKLLVDWYRAAQTLDILLNDSDWLVQPRKAHTAMEVCNETLIWSQGIFNENYRTKCVKRPIYDREDSIAGPVVIDKE